MPSVILLPHDERIALANIYVIGSNYVTDPEEKRRRAQGQPVVALKPTCALALEGAPLRLPSFSQRVHFEVELLLLIGRQCRNVGEDAALAHVAGYGVGLDLIADDLHREAKAKGLPWAICKGFDGAAPVSRFVPRDAVADPQALCFTLDINGERRQSGAAADMVFGPARIVSFLSGIFTLQRGDVIYTGTPAGVGPLASGDRLHLDLQGLVSATFSVA